MTNAVAIREAPEDRLPPLTIDDICRYICPDATEAEAFMFLRLCQSQGLNPFVRDAYLVVYGQGQTRKASFIVGKDTFTKRADAQDELAGYRAGIIVLRDTKPIELIGSFYMDSDKLVGGWAEVERKDRAVTTKITVRLSEYAKNSGQWPTMAATMIRKVALVQALREAFPNPFRGLYDAAEMGLDPTALPESTVTVDSIAEPVLAPVAAPAITPPAPARNAQGARQTAQPYSLGECPKHHVQWLASRNAGGSPYHRIEGGYCNKNAVDKELRESGLNPEPVLDGQATLLPA